jgi:hypothetical protein
MLGYTSAGAGVAAAAKIGCGLSLGSPFLWQDSSLGVKIQEFWKFQHVDTPMESQIWFSDHASGLGLVYKGEQLRNDSLNG